MRDPAMPLRTPKKREALPDVLTMGELERLLAAARPRRSLGAPLPWQARTGPTVARALRLRRPAPQRTARTRLGRRRPLAAAAPSPQGEGRPPADVPIHPALAPLFADYYATRVPLVEQAVFVGVQGKRAQLHPARPGLPPLRRRKRRQPAQARHPAHPSPRLRLRTLPPARTCARSRSCSATSTSTQPSATRA